MAVRISNVNNSRKSRMWSEQDDAQLAILLKRKIKDTSVAIRESETPYERSRLKAQRERYKEMLRKVEAGSYNGDIIFNELRASAALREEAALSRGLHSSMAGGKAYNNAYGDVDFDYEAAFRKKRYYGISLPIILLLLTLVVIASLFMGMLSPSLISQDVADKIEDTVGINVNSLFVYRLGNIGGEDVDVAVRADNNGVWNWPKADYPNGKPEEGQPWVDENGVEHDKDNEVVYLNQDLGCTLVYIDAADIIKAWFKTKMLEKTKISILEDQEVFQGTSSYYSFFLSGTKASELVIKKNDEGKYDFGVIYNHIGTYGTIMFLLATIVCLAILLIQNIVRIFTFTSRKFHFFTFLAFLFSALTLISPVFATSEGTEIGGAFSNYFMNLTASADFLAEESTATIGVTLLALIPAVLCLVMLILPKFFKNRHRTFPKRIPAGNKVHA